MLKRVDVAGTPGAASVPKITLAGGQETTSIASAMLKVTVVCPVSTLAAHATEVPTAKNARNRVNIAVVHALVAPRPLHQIQRHLVQFDLIANPLKSDNLVPPCCISG